MNIMNQFVSSKAKAQISKRVFQENKACQIVWRALFSWNTRFEIRPSNLLLTNYRSYWII